MRKRKYKYGLGFLLLASCLLFAGSSGALAFDDNTVTEVSNFEEFSDAVTELVDTYTFSSGQSGEGAEDIFCNRRLIVRVKSDGLDYKQYQPVSVIEAGCMYILQFDSCEKTKYAMKQLEASGQVVYAEPDYNMEAEAVSEGTSTHHSWGVSEIAADKLAASLTQVGTQELKVAVIDSGVAAHPFLNGRVIAGRDFVDDDDDPTDLNRHGTHVAGTVVDCTPGLNVKIMPVRVLDAQGRGLSLTVGLGIRYAVDHGASVINLSLSGRHSKFLDDNIAYAIERGATVVVAAGNEGKDTAQFCPSHLDEAIIVGAVNSDLEVAGFSNRGASLDVVAPGVNIIGPVLGSQFDSLSGTSMAAPHVSALAAMYKLQDLSRTPTQIETLIKSNAMDLCTEGWDSVSGFGLAEAYKTYRALGVTLSKSKLSLVIGKNATLKASVSPSGAPETLSWKSSNKKVATVKNGKVTAKKTGKTTITVTTDSGKQATCKVKVTKKAVPKKVTLSKEKLSLKLGSSATLQATVSPKGAVQTLSWKSSNKKVATVKNGKVTAKKVGKAVITVKTKNGKKASCNVTVTPKTVKQPKKVKLNQKKLSLEIGSSAKLKATVSPKGAEKKLSWKSSNKKIATVKNGKVVAKKAGKATITVTTKNGKKASCKVTVKEQSQNVQVQSQELENYRQMLMKNTKYKYFGVCYINEDDIPDLVAVTEKNSSNHVYYINGAEAADQVMFIATDIDTDIEGLTYYYYPKQNLVMYRYKGLQSSDLSDENAPLESYWFEGYAAFVPCNKYGYKYGLMEHLNKQRTETANGTLYEYGYTYFTDASDLWAQYDDLLDKYVVEKGVNEAEFNGLLAGFTKNVQIQEVNFVENTPENRDKYLR